MSPIKIFVEKVTEQLILKVVNKSDVKANSLRIKSEKNAFLLSLSSLTVVKFSDYYLCTNL